jgi:dTDP-4-amino-4,6-dideoxygalactose transaminase
MSTGSTSNILKANEGYSYESGTKRFEKEFSEFIGNGAETIIVNSVCACLHFVLEATKIAPGNEIIYPI